jgi:cell division protease FtsH
VRSSYKTIGLWVILIALFIAFYQVFQHSTSEDVTTLSFTTLLNQVKDKKITAITIKGNKYTGTYPGTKDGFKSVGPAADTAIVQKMRDDGVDVTFEPPEETSIWLTILSQWMPVVFLFLFFIFFMRQLQGTGGKAMTFGKSKAKLLNESHNKVTFSDVAGIDECKEELEEIIAFLKDPKKFTKLGGRIPKGVLMSGPPGTGKTLLAKAVAGEAGVPFFSISGSDLV